MPEACGYIGCERTEDVVRREHVQSGDTRRFCAQHDPLEDDDAAYQWQEADP